MLLNRTRLIALTSLGLCLNYGALRADNNASSTNEKATPTHAASVDTLSDKQAQIDMKKLSEAFGHFIGRNLQSPGLSFDLDSIIKGIREGAAGKPAPLSEKDYEEMMAAVQEHAFKEMSASNLKAANEFMEKNAKEKNVVEVVPHKLQYIVLQEGKGTAVDAHSSPKIHYTGKYQDGTVFGTSEEMGGPITIPLDQTIPGFSKGIVGMKEGEKRRLFVHPDLGYGTTGQLPPNELLIFEIDVVKANADENDKNGAQNDGQEDADDDEEFFSEEDLEFVEEPVINKPVVPVSPSKPVSQH
mgnify:CR=1 FL=1